VIYRSCHPMAALARQPHGTLAVRESLHANCQG